MKFVLGSDQYPGLAKLVEEMAELITVLAKLITTDGDSHYWSGRDLSHDLLEELGDVKCALAFFEETSLTSEERAAVVQRAAMKLERYRRWSYTDPKDDRSTVNP